MCGEDWLVVVAFVAWVGCMASRLRHRHKGTESGHRAGGPDEDAIQ